MAKDDNAAGADQPHDGAERRRDQTDRNRDDVQTSVELRGREASRADLEVLAVQLANDVHAEDNEDDVEQKPRVGEKGVDAEHHEDDGIVAGEVAQVVVDARLDFGEVLRLRHPLDIEELRDRAEVGKTAGHRGRAKATEPVSQVEPARQSVDRDREARHVEGRLVGYGQCMECLRDVLSCLMLVRVGDLRSSAEQGGQTLADAEEEEEA